MSMTRLPAFLLLGCALALPAAARPLAVFDSEEEEAELKDAQEELKQIERKIARKDIPPIEFEFNSAKLRPYSKQTLELVADLMLRHTQFKLFIGGHTCDIGSAEYNEQLSQKRAEAVKDYLVELGVMGEFMRAKGYGESRPIDPNETEEGRKKNRRVEFQLLTRWWNSVY